MMRKALNIGTLRTGLPEWHSDKKICLPMQEPQETWVLPLSLEDPLEKEMATYSSILAGTILCGPLSMGSQRVGHD